MKKTIKDIIVKLNLVNLISIIFYFFRLFPIDRKKVVMINHYGKGYGDSGKYIAEQLLDKDVTIYWALKDITTVLPQGIKGVKIDSLAYMYHLSTAKIWINNMRFPQYIRKRKEQYYVQIWHGCLALKKIEFDAYEKLTAYYQKWMVRDTDMTDLMVSNSDFATELFRRAFRYTGEILNVGTPRNDILVSNNSDIPKRVRQFFNIHKEEKILLYAPTFRDDYTKNPYDLDFEEIKKLLEQVLGGTWRIMIRLHPNVKNPELLIKNLQSFIDATDYPDMQELLIASSLLITDYSSTMFEAMIIDKKVVLYTNDLDSYNQERGTYFDIEELPFMYATDQDDFLKKLQDISTFKFEEKYHQFKEKINLNETGQASKYVAERISQEMKEC